MTLFGPFWTPFLTPFEPFWPFWAKRAQKALCRPMLLARPGQAWAGPGQDRSKRGPKMTPFLAKKGYFGPFFDPFLTTFGPFWAIFLYYNGGSRSGPGQDLVQKGVKIAQNGLFWAILDQFWARPWTGNPFQPALESTGTCQDLAKKGAQKGSSGLPALLGQALYSTGPGWARHCTALGQAGPGTVPSWARDCTCPAGHVQSLSTVRSHSLSQ